MRRISTCFLFLSWFAANAQTPRPYTTRPIPSQWTTIAIAREEGRLKVELPSPEIQPWIMGIVVGASGRDAMDIGEVHLEEARAKLPIQRISQIAPIPASQISSIPGRAAVLGTGSREHRLLIYIDLAEPTTVTISSGNSQPIYMNVEASMIVANGVVVGRDLRGRSELVLLAASNGVRGWGQARPILSGGDYVVGMDTLRTQLSKYVDLGRVTSSGTQTFVLRLRVGTEGTVEEVTSLTDPMPNFFPSIASSIRQWTFRPILRDGRPIAVVSDVPFVVDRDGHVACALSPDVDPR